MATSYVRLLWALALYFEMRQLLWFKAKWKKAEEDFSQPGTLYEIATMYYVLLMKMTVTSVDYSRNSSNW